MRPGPAATAAAANCHARTRRDVQNRSLHTLVVVRDLAPPLRAGAQLPVVPAVRCTSADMPEPLSRGTPEAAWSRHLAVR